MRTMCKIIGWILSIFFVLCGVGAITDGAWPAAALFMIAGFVAIPLPNKQLQALRITPWPGLALSLVVAGIAMWLAIGASSPPLPTEKADKNFKVYDAGHSKHMPLFVKRTVGDLTIFSDAKTYEERIHTVLYAAKQYLEQEDLKYVRVLHLSYPHEALIGAGAIIAKGEYAPDGKGDGSGPLAHKTWQASAVKGEVNEVEALIEVMWYQMRDRYQVTHESGRYTYTDEPALKQAISEAIKGSIPPDEIGLPTYRLVDYDPGFAATSAPAEEIKSAWSARSLEQAQAYTPLLQKLHASQPTAGTNPGLQRGLCVLSRLWYPRLSDRTSGAIGKRCAKRASSLLCWHETRFCKIFYATLGYTILEVEDYPAPQGKGRYKVIAHSENARTFEQRAQTAIQIAVDWHNKTQAYEILVWLEILPELSARVAIADYYPLNVTAWGKSPPYQLQVEATSYQAGMNGEYKAFDIIFEPYNFSAQQAAPQSSKYQ